jgi:DnaJ domain
VSADHYQVLGVAPGAEEAVIRAAYRALIRLYHPDTNDDPKAQSRVREITAAFAVLGDPAKRAAYDARRAIGGAMAIGESWFAADRVSPPPMRNLGLASIAVALAVSLAFALPKSEPEPEPQALRNLAAYRGVANAAPTAEPARTRAMRAADRAILANDSLPTAAVTAPPPAPMLRAAPAPSLAPTPLPPKREIAQVERPKAPIPAAIQQSARAAPGAVAAASCPQCQDRRAEVERLATSFLKQSLDHADWHKQQLLLSARNRSATSRNMCHSDDCVTDAYLRQIRDTTTIMEGRIPNP